MSSGFSAHICRLVLVKRECQFRFYLRQAADAGEGWTFGIGGLTMTRALHGLTTNEEMFA